MAAAVMAACSSSTVPELPAGAVALDIEPFPEPVAQYLHSGLRERARLVIRDADTWEQIWLQVTAHYQPQPPVPEVDFGSSMIVLAAMGGRATGGYAISVDDVYEAEGRLYAMVRETSPGPGCGVTTALTAPMTAVLVPGRDGPVEFVEQVEELVCQ